MSAWRKMQSLRREHPQANIKNPNQGQSIGRAVNRQCHNQRDCNLTKMSRRVCVEVAGRAGGTDMMDVFANEEEQGVSSSRRNRYGPARTVAQTFRQNGKERYAQKCSGCETNQRAKRLVRQVQRRADRSTGKSENISRNDLPESDLTIHYFAVAKGFQR